MAFMWNSTYRRTVLDPDYLYAREHLLPHFFDALSAHVTMLDSLGVPHAGAALTVLRAMRARPFPPPDPAVEDVFFTIDRQLAGENLGAAGALRTALSRNDLDMTVYRLSAREACLGAQGEVLALRAALLELAGREAETVIVAHTHHQPAQPTTLAHYLCALENVLSRDTGRLENALARVNLSPMGAVALAGSGFPLDRDLTARLLAFDRPVENTYDAVSAGDWQVELAGAVTTCATTLSRALYDLLLWASRGLLTLADGLVQGSSVMPQKRNPVALEHARTKLGRALGGAQSVIFCAHNVPFGDVNDVGADVQPALHAMWREFGEALELLTVSLEAPHLDRDAWLREAQSGESAVTELADALTRHAGGDFRAGHRAARQLLEALREQGRPLSSATAADLAEIGWDVPQDLISDALDPRAFVARRQTFGGPAPDVVRAHLAFAGARLARDFETRQAWKERLAAARSVLSGAS